MVKWNLFKESEPTKSGEYLVLVRNSDESYSLKNGYWFDGVHNPFEPTRKLSDIDWVWKFKGVSDGYVGLIEYDDDAAAWYDLLHRPWEPIAWISCRELVEEMIKNWIFGKEGTK